MPEGHGRCRRHELYDLDCEDFEQLRARAGDRCEMPGCGATGPDTKSGMLFIDHDGPFRIPGTLVRGLLCCRCNNGLGRVETRPASRFYRPPTDAEIAYLDRPFWREPEQQVSRQRKADHRAALQETVRELAKYARRRRSRFDGFDRVDAIGYALDQGLRQADIERGTPWSEGTIYKAAKLHRERRGPSAHDARRPA